jgi:hypothetical protein
MIPNIIKVAMDKQSGQIERPVADISSVIDCLRSLGLDNHLQLRDFFSNYKLSGVQSKRAEELLDLCSPTRQIAEATYFGRDIYGISDDFICLTSGEGEGFLLYSKLDQKIYDVAVSELGTLASGEKTAGWESFYDLIEWYLS